MAPSTGAHVIARALRDLGVTVVFGLVGIPVVDIAEECIDLGIRFIAFRNEQACSYAATAYGYITGKPGVCLLVGGPGVLHGMAGIGNASANAFPTLFIAGSSERDLTTKGAFQEMDAISLLTPHTKVAIRPSSNEPSVIVSAINNAYRVCWYGRPGPTFVDLPADLIMDRQATSSNPMPHTSISPPPKPSASSSQISTAADLLRSAQSPLVILGKGAAYSRSEHVIRSLITRSNLPFLPTPMGKGIVPDSSPLNTSSARSAALKSADVILLLGARLNWILHFGAPPKFRHDVKIIQVDISAEELGRLDRVGEPSLSILGEIGTVVEQLSAQLGDWKAFPAPFTQMKSSPSSSFPALLSASALKNEANAQKAALTPTKFGAPLTYQRAFHIIRETLHSLSPSDDGGVVYVSEGANTMDISRSAFPLSHPRQRLDAGTYATMGVGMGYAIAAWAAYNFPEGEENKPRKKIVALEGDSALGFSAMEIETMARLKMDVLIVVMNNSGLYHGDTFSQADWDRMQQDTVAGRTALAEETDVGSQAKKGLRSTSLWYETRYEKLADMVGGRGYFVRSEQELETATREGFLEKERVVVINVCIEPGVGKSVSFAWQQGKEKHGNAKATAKGEAKL